ncbi:MAG: hypothetical protein ACFCBW_03435, partial [Candidatus Competibacterales bacterium]
MEHRFHHSAKLAPGASHNALAGRDPAATASGRLTLEIAAADLGRPKGRKTDPKRVPVVVALDEQQRLAVVDQNTGQPLDAAAIDKVRQRHSEALEQFLHREAQRFNAPLAALLAVHHTTPAPGPPAAPPPRGAAGRPAPAPARARAARGPRR